MSIWKWQVNSSSRFVSFFIVVTHNSSLNFKLIHFLLWINGAHKRANFLDFWVLESKFVKFVMSNLKRQVNSSSNFASLLTFMTQKSSVNFKLIHFLLWIKGSHQSPNYETFECSGKDLSNSSYHFPNHKSVFLQILHPYSVSWNVTLLYFLSSNIIYFVRKEIIKVQNFETFECSSTSSCQFWNDRSIPLQIFHHSSFSLRITPL